MKILKKLFFLNIINIISNGTITNPCNGYPKPKKYFACLSCGNVFNKDLKDEKMKELEKLQEVEKRKKDRRKILIIHVFASLILLVWLLIFVKPFLFPSNPFYENFIKKKPEKQPICLKYKRENLHNIENMKKI
jgi:hypothetical protein